MKNRIEEIEELLENNKIWDWIGEVCDWNYTSMRDWEDKIREIVELEIEKRELENRYKLKK